MNNELPYQQTVPLVDVRVCVGVEFGDTHAFVRRYLTQVPLAKLMIDGMPMQSHDFYYDVNDRMWHYSHWRRERVSADDLRKWLDRGWQPNTTADAAKIDKFMNMPEVAT